MLLPNRTMSAFEGALTNISNANRGRALICTIVCRALGNLSSSWPGDQVSMWITLRMPPSFFRPDTNEYFWNSAVLVSR